MLGSSLVCFPFCKCTGECVCVSGHDCESLLIPIQRSSSFFLLPSSAAGWLADYGAGSRPWLVRSLYAFQFGAQNVTASFAIVPRPDTDMPAVTPTSCFTALL